MAIRDLFRRSQTKGQFRGYPLPDQIASSLITRAEANRTQFSRGDAGIREILPRLLGTVDIWTSRNATACAAQTVRLYGRGASRQRSRSLSKHRVKGLIRSSSGKVASFLESSDDVREITDHPVLAFIQNPNPMFPGTTLAWMNFKWLFAGGNAFNFITDHKGFKLAWPGYPQYVAIDYSKTDLIERYWFGRETDSMLPFDPGETAHYRNIPSRHNPLIGEGDLISVLGDQDLLVQVLANDLAMAQGGNRPDSLVKVDPATTPKQIEAIYAEIEKRTSGRRGVKAFVASALDWNPITWPSKELQTNEQVERYERHIRQALGIPESMADSNDSTYAGAWVSDGQHGQWVRAKINDHADQMSAMLLPMFDLDPNDYCLAYDDPVPRDEQRDATVKRQLTDGGIMTVNEVRAELGFEPSKDEMADKLLFNGQPLGQAAADPLGGLFGGGGSARPFGEPKQDAEADTDKSFTQAAKETLVVSDERKAETLKSMLAAESDRWAECEHCGVHTKDDDDLFPTPLLRELMRRFLGPFASVFEDIIGDAQDDAVRAIAAGSQPNLRANAAQAATEIERVVSEVVLEAQRSTVETLNSPEDAFEVVPDRALEFIQTHAVEVSDDIMGTTGEMARIAVERGLEQGLSVDEIAKEIEGVPAWRAERIARTEVQEAAQAGKVAGFRDAGVTHVRVVNAPGASVAHTMIAARSPKPIGEPFVRAGETLDTETFKRDMDRPPFRPNCRCDLQPVLKTGGA